MMWMVCDGDGADGGVAEMSDGFDVMLNLSDDGRLSADSQQQHQTKRSLLQMK